ncbi:MAG TPA: hypothetical protein VG056_00620 [Pirellulales bacterium]|jgi:hypothetical protein|nr:hypothetical protein [Pirellulales bacterium]
MLFIVSNSFDTTVDLLILRLGTADIFRFNFDLWRDYKLEISPDGFRLEDPAGRVVTDRTITKFLWRKPARSAEMFPGTKLAAEDIYYEQELWYALCEIANLMWARRKLVLVEPFVDIRVGKFVQLDAARNYFQVPPYRMSLGIPFPADERKQSVVKSLTSEPVGRDSDHAVLFTSRVDPSELSMAAPWLVQQYIAAELDVTVQVVRDRVFAFELDRRSFLDRSIDWRALAADETSDRWRPHRLPEDVEQNIFRFMQRLALHFGRIDFLYGNGVYHFLEINPNGQWAWLDAEGRHGLLDKVVGEISPATPCIPIPMIRDQRP